MLQNLVNQLLVVKKHFRKNYGEWGGGEKMKWVNKPNVMSAGASPIGCFVDPCDFCGLYLCWTYKG